MNVSGDESKIRCCKEQYCIGTWNVRSRNQGKLDMMKQEMVRINFDILGISELKWTGMGDFNSITIISTSMGKNPLGEMKSPSVNKSPKCSQSVQLLSRVSLFATP